MHEMAIAGNILAAVEQEMARHPGAELKSFDIEVGEFSCVQNEALRFCLDAAIPDTPWPEAVANITTQPVQATCLDCGTTFKPDDAWFVCPECRGGNVEITNGRDVNLISLEIEE